MSAHSSGGTAQRSLHTYTHTHPTQPFHLSCSPVLGAVPTRSFYSHASPSAPAQYAFSSETGGSGGGGGGGGGGRTGGSGNPEEGGEGDNSGNISKLPVVDGMTRYPELSVRGMLRSLDYFGTLVFASSGTLTAGMAGMDLLGCIVVGTITAIGGGTVRDLLLGKAAFWLDETEYVLMSVVTALLTFYFWPRDGQTGRPVDDTEFLFWSDTLGVGAFCVIGAQNGVRAGLHPVICAMCGMFTATFGGLIRDVLCARPVRILHSKQEIYATTALAGGSMYTLLRMAGMPLSARIIGGFATAILLRYFAWTHNIRLPTFNPPEPDRTA